MKWPHVLISCTSAVHLHILEQLQQNSKRCKMYLCVQLIKKWPLIIRPTHNHPLGQNKAKTIQEELHSVKNNSYFEIAALFPSPNRWWKSAAISKLELFLTERSRSYIFFALENYRDPVDTDVILFRGLPLSIHL